MEYLFVTGWSMGNHRGGLSQYVLDHESGELSLISKTAETTDYGTVFFNREKKVIYALNEDRELGASSVDTYKIDLDTGDKELIGKADTLMPFPSYLGVAPAGKYACVSDHSYGAASLKLEKDENGVPHAVKSVTDAAVILFPVLEDGSLGEAVDAVVHTGSGVLPRQNMPHPHCVVFSPLADFFAVCDKGNDQIYIYRIKDSKLDLVNNWHVTPGSMPRYALFHPEKPFFYYNNEGDEFVCAYTYDKDGNFEKTGEYSVVAQGHGGKFMQQGLCMDNDGRHIYAAEGITGQIAVLEIDQESGALKPVQYIGHDYDGLRGICLAPEGDFLIATYMKSGKVVVFKVGPDGRLTDTGCESDCDLAADIEFAY